MRRRLALEQSVKLVENPDVLGTVVDSLPGWVQVVHTHPRVIRGQRQWYCDRRVAALGTSELQWEELA